MSSQVSPRMADLKLNFFFLISALLLFTWIAAPAFAQQPLSDGEAKGTLFLDTGGFVQFNAADPSIRLAYIYDKTKLERKTDWMIGAGVTAKLTDKQGSILGNNKIAANAAFDFSAGLKYLFTKKFVAEEVEVTTVFIAGMQRVLRDSEILSKDSELPSVENLETLLNRNGNPKQLKNNPTLAKYLDALTTLCVVLKKTDSFCEIKGQDIGAIFKLPELKKYGNFDRLVFQGGYNFRQYNLFNPKAPFADQHFKQDFHNPSAQAIYTFQHGGNKLYGVGMGIEKANNSSDLTEIDVRDFMTTTSHSTTREFGRTKKALLGDFRQYTRVFVNTDVAFFPASLKSRFGINFFTRSEVVGDNKSFRPGVGLFISEKGAPTRVIGGASISLDENRRAKISLVAGYNF